VTGAVINPALAFSTQFPCSGNSFLEYCLVYWLSPLLGKTPEAQRCVLSPLTPQQRVFDPVFHMTRSGFIIKTNKHEYIIHVVGGKLHERMAPEYNSDVIYIIMFI